jgi:phage terminase large subunit-like protein
MKAWDACGAPVHEEELAGRHCYAGLDLSSKSDLTAFVMLFPSDAGYEVLPVFWIPEERMRDRVRRDGVPYDVWVNQGLIRTTPGNVVDYDFIRRDINAFNEKYDIREIAIDRWNSTHLQTQLMGDGFNIVQFGQGFASMAAPTSELEKVILAKEIHHGGHPVLRWNMSNVAVQRDAAGNMKPDKSKSSEKIDGVVALVMALGRAMVQPPEESTRSVYEKRGVLVL